MSLTPPATAIADNTIDALRSGVVFGYVGLVTGLIDAALSQVGPAMVVATGTAPWVDALVAACPAIDHYDEMLTLRGLRLVYERNTQSANPLKPDAPVKR